MTTPGLKPDTIGGALTRLNRDRQHLPRALKRIAEHIQRDPQRVLFQTVTELATDARAGDASVIRLCQTLGFKGFQDFKLALAADLAQRPHHGDGAPQSVKEVMASTLARTNQSLQDTYQGLESPVLEEAARRLATAGRVELSGQGASGITAQDFGYQLIRLGKHASVHTDPHLAAMRAATLSPLDVAFAISRSGSTIDSVQFLKLARQAGAFTIAMTISRLSPIAEYADCVLLTANPEGPSEGGSISNKFSQMLVLEVLHQLLRPQLSQTDEFLHLTAAAVADKSY